MHLVGFIIRIYHDARSYECKIRVRSRVFIKFPVAVCEPRVLCIDSSTSTFTSEHFIFSRFWRTAGSADFQLTLWATSSAAPTALAVLRKPRALLNTVVQMCRILRRLHFFAYE